MANFKRSFGWVQNPSDFTTLKYITGIFDKNSDAHADLVKRRLPLIKRNHYISEENYDKFMKILSERSEDAIPYSVLKGQGAGGRKRAEAMCTGIVQACIDGQKRIEYEVSPGKRESLKKLYSDDWTADGYLRWTISLGLLEYSYGDDTCRLSEMGKMFVKTGKGSAEEKAVLTKALLSYPPVMRILSLLADGDSMTKFEIGSQLGFKAELGFTSISQDYFIALWNEAETQAEKSKIRANIEGDSDKYARMICSWLQKMGWVKSSRVTRQGVFNGRVFDMTLHAYSLTAKGLREYRKAAGNSSNSRIPKVVMYEMLATKAPNAGYLRFRRAVLIESLIKPRSIDSIVKYLEERGCSEFPQTVIDDIEGLVRIGLEITRDEVGRYKLKDKITALRIPVTHDEREDITEIKERLRENLTEVSHDYLILVDLAYSDAAIKTLKNLDARNFEIYTAELMTKVVGFEGRLLGGADRPDVVVWKDNHGVIVDNKSYKDGFSIGRKNEDEMCRYINQAQRMTEGFPTNNWWKCFQENKVSDLHYLFVTSFLKGYFVQNMKSIRQRSGVNGGAVGVANLLYFAEHVKRGNMTPESICQLMDNEEIVFQAPGSSSYQTPKLSFK